MIRPSRRSLPAAVLAAAVLSGCNDSPRVGDRANIENTVETLLALCAQEEGPGVVDVLAEDTRRTFLEAGGVLEGCQAVLGLDPPTALGADLFVRARVGDVSRHGDQARAVVRAGDQRATVNLLDTGVKWFISNPPRYDLVGVDDVP